jgi:molecular chaperone GrpE
VTDPSARPDGEVPTNAPPEAIPPENGDPTVTPDPFAPSDRSGVDRRAAAPGGDGEPATTSAPGGGTILADAASLAAERDEYLADLQRLKAEFDNYRKRVARQQEEQSDRAAGALVGKLLPVLDNLDLAYTHLTSAHLTAGPAGPTDGAGESDAPVSEEARALLQAREQLLDALAKEGLARVDEVGVEFDPVVHDAVASVQSDGPAEAGADGGGMAVDEVMRAGYRWRSQVLRPAMVRVRS